MTSLATRTPQPALEDRYGPAREKCQVEREFNGRKGPESTTPCIATAGWGTDHVGYGPCSVHEVEEKTKGVPLVIKNERLSEIVKGLKEEGGLENLDSEILLLKGLIYFTAEHVGVKASVDEDGVVTLETNPSHPPTSFLADATYISRTIDRLSETIKRKYEILQIAGMVIPRDAVRSYLQQLSTSIDQVLRDTCSECGHEHGMRDKVITALELLGDL